MDHRRAFLTGLAGALFVVATPFPQLASAQSNSSTRLRMQLRQLNQRQQGNIRQQQRTLRDNSIDRDQRRLFDERLRLDGAERTSRELRDRRAIQREMSREMRVRDNEDRGR